MAMPVIMVTNDDGILAPGIAALEAKLMEAATVYTVAPDRERSASGHSLTIDRPLKVTEVGPNRYSVSGTPTDCVAVGLDKVMPQRPDLIVSGINHGPNLGDDITYSGTVAAAMEGTIYNMPSVAVSLVVMNGAKPLFESAAEVALRVVRMLLEHPLPYDTLLNVNVPNMPFAELRGFRMCRQGKRVYDGAIKEARSPWGEKLYWIGGGTPYWEHAEDTDINAIQNGYVSITPLQLDLTNYWAMDYLNEKWKSWNLKA